MSNEINPEELRKLVPDWLDAAADEVRADLASVADRYRDRLEIKDGRLTARREVKTRA